MSTKKRSDLITTLKSHMLLRLWAAIMLIVVIAVAFLWVVQILLFEPNYIDATMNAMLDNVHDSAAQLEDAEDIEPGGFEDPLHYLSKTITGRLFVVDGEGGILLAYNNGSIDGAENLAETYGWLVDYHYQEVLNGADVAYLSPYFEPKSIIVMGVPATYRGQRVAILLYDSVDEIDTLLSLNRSQLAILSIVLTLVASLVAYVLARHFARPIQKIKATVDKLTEGDLSATPGLKRSDELGKLSDSVEKLGKELQRVDVLRNEVIANVSHELRAPLALIAGYSEMVRDVTGDDPDKRSQNMDLILHEANRLSDMVDDILDYSQMQAGYSEPKLEACNLYEVVESAVIFGNDIGRQYGIAVTLKSDSKEIAVELDALKISQVLRNLLNNAINHTEDGKSVAIEISHEDAAICVSVRNPGEEIPPEQLELIWERYQQVQHQGGHKEGTGIGLAIVSTILDAHGYAYGARSADGVNCFWFSIGD